MKKFIILFFVIIAGCGYIRVYYSYTPQLSRWPRVYNYKFYLGEFTEITDSVYGELNLVGTENPVRNLFHIEPRNFLRLAIEKELKNSEFAQVSRRRKGSDYIVRGVLRKFYIKFLIHKIPQQPNGIEYKFNSFGEITADIYLYQNDRLLYTIRAKSHLQDKGEMFMWGHWEDIVKDELDRMLRPLIFTVLDSIDNFLARRE